MGRFTAVLGAALGIAVLRRPIELVGAKLLAVAADDPGASAPGAPPRPARPERLSPRP